MSAKPGELPILNVDPSRGTTRPRASLVRRARLLAWIGLGWHGIEAAVAIGRGELGRAADILHSTGSLAFEAHARLRAAQQLAELGRRAEVASQLAVALSFYRGVGAAAAVRAAEELLPATG